MSTNRLIEIYKMSMDSTIFSVYDIITQFQENMRKIVYVSKFLTDPASLARIEALKANEYNKMIQMLQTLNQTEIVGELIVMYQAKVNTNNLSTVTMDEDCCDSES